MKRILTALMALLVVMSFAVALIACDTGIDTGDDNKPPVTDKDGNTIVSIMVHVDRQSAEGKAYQKRVDAFNVAHAEKKIKATITFKARTTGATSYETELNTMRMEGTLPDIITFDAPNCASYAYNELLADISSLIPGDVQSDFYSLNTYNGKLYGLPIQESSAGFYYNKKLFAAAGIDVSAYTVENPWTFDQFKEVCAKLKNYLGNGKAVDMRLDATKDETATYLLYPFIYAAVGVHPDGVGELNEENFQWLREQCAHPKAVAVGEIGLDYYWDTAPRQQQREWFVRQMELAVETKLPVIIHSREAAQETFELISQHHAHTTGGVIHCYSYSKEMALEYVKMGYYIGIGGVVTFKNARKLKETAEAVPLSSILLETDSPYLAPVPNRGKRNSSLNLPYVAQEIAQIKGITAEEVIETTNRNAKKLFLEGRA